MKPSDGLTGAPGDVGTVWAQLSPDVMPVIFNIAVMALIVVVGLMGVRWIGSVIT